MLNNTRVVLFADDALQSFTTIRPDASKFQKFYKISYHIESLDALNIDKKITNYTV
jgi:hypothetical protein